MYGLFLVLHVICAALWLAAFPAMHFITKTRRRSKGSIGELHYMRSAASIGTIFGNIGGVGILITGGAIAGIGGWGWFEFGTLPWLAWKQVIFVLILSLVFAVIIPRSKRARVMLGERFSLPLAQSGATEELRAAYDALYTLQLIVNILVLVNLSLGVLKPMF